MIFLERSLISCLNEIKNKSLTIIVSVEVMDGRKEAVCRIEPMVLTSLIVNIYVEVRFMAFTKKTLRVYFIMMPVTAERDIIASSTKQSSSSNWWVYIQTTILAVVAKTAVAKDLAIKTYVGNYWCILR